MRIALFVGLAGAVGALCRVGIGELVGSVSNFPVATFTVNLSGTFILCFLSAGVIRRMNMNEELQTTIMTGFLGSFTTFSAFSFETVSLFQDGLVLLALSYIACSLVGGLLFGVIGMGLGRKAGRG